LALSHFLLRRVRAEFVVRLLLLGQHRKLQWRHEKRKLVALKQILLFLEICKKEKKTEARRPQTNSAPVGNLSPSIGGM